MDRMDPAAILRDGDFEAFKWLLLEMAQHITQLLLRLDATEDKMRMLVTGWQKSACNFDARVARLDGLLRKGQIPPYESIDIWGVGFGGYLRESGLRHEMLLSCEVGKEKTADAELYVSLYSNTEALNQKARHSSLV